MGAQLELFKPQALAPPLEPVDARISALAAAVPKGVRLGSSSWTFPGWAGLVYRRNYRTDAQFIRESLYEYARWPIFRTVGIDRSFYAPISDEDLATYAAQLPDGYLCVSKVWQELSTYVFSQHPKNGSRAGQLNTWFLDPERFEERVAGPYRRAFKRFAGPFVFEISPLPAGPIDNAVFEQKLEDFLQRAPDDFRYAFELRDVRLMRPRYFEILKAHGASHCFNQWARMPSIAEQMHAHGPITHDVVSRLLLPPGGNYAELKKAYAPFDKLVAPLPGMRDDVLALAEAAMARGAESFIIINNKAEGSSPLTALALADRLRRDNFTPVVG